MRRAGLHASAARGAAPPAAWAARLARDGGHVVCHHFAEPDAVAGTAERVRRAGATPHVIEAELRDPEAAATLVDRAVGAGGGLDVLVNAAGVMREHAPAEQPRDDWDTTIAVNLTATYLTCYQAVPHLRDRGGAIVNLASQLALKGAAGLAAYTASKGGIIAMTRTLAREVGPRVRVYALAPGPTETGMIAPYADEDWRRERTASLINARVAEPEEVAEVAAFAVAEEGGLLQGQTLHCNGGGVLQ
ncbi:SDR family NAD(P)-dependent oxidoreductase [Egibacter rhizosphaerae]|uniref:SDR family NAD(P)-dependent oxidoreductase n=1 Tax=Egibacter rhizosphaerae TaxID=1670831 RepID=UPI001F0E195A|nr:SDR family oxidoreductase [Egibacter rhizosphaerae]